MSLDTVKIENFVKRNAEIMIKQVLFKFQSSKHIRVRPGIKYRETFGRLATDAIFQAASCGWNPQGVTKLDDIELAVEAFEIKENVCDQDLIDTYYNMLGAAGSMEDAAEFNLEKDYVDAKTAKVQDAIERLVWRGDTALSDPKYNRFDGLLKKLKEAIPDARSGNVTIVADVADQPYVQITIDAAVDLEDGAKVTLDLLDNSYDGTYEIHNFCKLATTSTFYVIATFTATSTGTWTEVNDQNIAKTASPLADFYSLADTMPDEFWDLPEKKYYLEPKDYRLLRKEIIDLGGTGNFHVDLTKYEDAFMFPGEDVMVVRVSGMSGAGDRVLTYRDNLWFGTDLENDFEKSKFFYDEGEDTHKFLMKMKGGTQNAHDHMVAIAS